MGTNDENTLSEVGTLKFLAPFTEFTIKFNAKKHNEIAESPFMTYTRVNRGGGGHNYFEYSLRKWPKSHTKNVFLRNGKIVYYQDVPQ